ncbi:type II toxin-antitoxin system HicA family toxin [Desulfofundulus thermocisternus]
MTSLPVVSGRRDRRAVRAFEKAGWKIARQRGSHIIMVKAGMLATLSILD